MKIVSCNLECDKTSVPACNSCMWFCVGNSEIMKLGNFYVHCAEKGFGRINAI